MRAFIFKHEGNDLVCRSFWAQNPTSEQVGVTRFHLTAEVAQTVAVVRCALDGDITRTPVTSLPASLEKVASHSVSQDLTFVLAAPILDRNQQVWGTVDFDTSNELGTERLSADLAATAIFKLTQYLQVMFSLRNDVAPVAKGRRTR